MMMTTAMMMMRAMVMMVLVEDGGSGADDDDVDEHCQLVWNLTNFHFHSFINFDLFPHYM